MNPTPTARKITPSDQPVFPCWLWMPYRVCGHVGWERFASPVNVVASTHWHPDQPTAPEPVVEGISPEKAERMVNQIWATAPDWAEQAAKEIMRFGGGKHDIAAIILRHHAAAQQDSRRLESYRDALVKITGEAGEASAFSLSEAQQIAQAALYPRTQ